MTEGVRVTCDCEIGTVTFEQAVSPHYSSTIAAAQARNNHDWLAHIDPERLGVEPVAQVTRMSIG